MFPGAGGSYDSTIITLLENGLVRYPGHIKHKQKKEVHGAEGSSLGEVRETRGYKNSYI